MALPGKGLWAGSAGRGGAIAHPRAGVLGRANKRLRAGKLCGGGEEGREARTARRSGECGEWEAAGAAAGGTLRWSAPPVF